MISPPCQSQQCLHYYIHWSVFSLILLDVLAALYSCCYLILEVFFPHSLLVIILPCWFLCLLWDFLVGFLFFILFYFSWFLLTILDLLILVHPGAQCLEIFFIYIHSLDDFNYFMALNAIYILVTHRFISLAQTFLLNFILLCPKTISSKSSFGYIKIYQININKIELLTFPSQHSCTLSDLS